MDFFKSRSGGFPIFNPSNQRTQPILIPDEIQVPDTAIEPERQNWLNGESTPVLLIPETLTLSEINGLAKYKTSNQIIAWAANVEAIEKPENFTLIVPASSNAYYRIHHDIDNSNEREIKSAVRSLMNSSKSKSEAVRAIAKNLGNESISLDYWNQLFDSEGASNAIQQKVYMSQMARLLTLRAIIIPETLPEFLNWLESANPSRHQSVAVQFQQDFVANFITEGNQIEKLYKRIEEGIKFLLPNLLNQKVTPTAVYWLLSKSESGSIWSDYADRFLLSIPKDVENIKNYRWSLSSDKLKENLQYEYEIWERLIDYYCYPDSPQPYYRPLAELLLQFRLYRFSAYFYQVSQGEVPDKIFRKAFPAAMYFQVKFLGVYLKKGLASELNFDPIINFIQRTIQVLIELLNLLFFLLIKKIILGIILFLVGIILGLNPLLNKLEAEVFNQLRQDIKPNLFPKELAEALNQFSTTRRQIESIVRLTKRQLSRIYSDFPEVIIINAVKTTLLASSQKNKPQLSYGGVIDKQYKSNPKWLKKRKINWIKAINLYQLHLKDFYGQYGILDYLTAEQLRDEVEKKAKQQLEIPANKLAQADKQFSQTQQGIHSISLTVYNLITVEPQFRTKLTEQYSIYLDGEKQDIDFTFESMIIDKIKESLGSSLSLNPRYFNDSTRFQSDREKLIKAIYIYQKYIAKVKNANGIIAPESETAQKLIKEIISKVKQELTY
ncbi:MAG: hypothetical protein AB4426_10015 [Xenococcaceae cyanobacterium]